MPKRGYHHGNLRQALVDAALTLIETRGPTGFTLSEAAKQAGVPPAAVYRHFAGRDDLIAEAARQGFVIFAEAQDKALGPDPSCPIEGFIASGHAYLRFAHDHPGHYMAMFESGIAVDRSPALAEAAARARARFDQAATRLCGRLPAANCPPADLFAAHVWALSHGIVELFARNPRPDGPAPEMLLETALTTYLHGLGLSRD
ncbi:MAG TPA: TetR family transcriptional regulator [Roseovarius nubinhibens]|uniref:TetR family transcriptional regulator n=1 Tax=Roseovarius nubinhibens TaxID=314263 RepID=A0A348W7Z9_9RHOB|nr:TetR family transcriptional regulator [Roseovarius nubinhibens]